MNRQNEDHLQELLGSDVSNNGTDDDIIMDIEIVDEELEEVVVPEHEEEDEHQVRDQILAELEEADEERLAMERRHHQFWSRL